MIGQPHFLNLKNVVVAGTFPGPITSIRDSLTLIETKIIEMSCDINMIIKKYSNDVTSHIPDKILKLKPNPYL